jgi:hypothetical protein
MPEDPQSRKAWAVPESWGRSSGIFYEGKEVREMQQIAFANVVEQPVMWGYHR